MKTMSTPAYRRAIRAANAVKQAANKRRATRACFQAMKQMLDSNQSQHINKRINK